MFPDNISATDSPRGRLGNKAYDSRTFDVLTQAYMSVIRMAWGNRVESRSALYTSNFNSALAPPFVTMIVFLPLGAGLPTAPTNGLSGTSRRMSAEAGPNCARSGNHA